MSVAQLVSATEVVVSDGLKTGGDANFIAQRMMRLAGMLFWVFYFVCRMWDTGFANDDYS